MVEVLVGDIFRSKAQTLVNTVNTVGVMGKGLALDFRKRFPDMYEEYRRRCAAGEVRLGRPYLHRSLLLPWILNFPTKEHWRSVARLDAIVQGLEYLEVHYKEWGIESIAVPPLGSGEGKLEWRIVGRTLYRHLARLDIPVELYAPFGTPHEELQPTFLGSEGSAREPGPSRIPPGWVALVAILRRIEEEPHHWPVGRTTFQKMAYFAGAAGIPVGLDFERSSFGPHTPQLKGLLTRLVNNGLIVEHRRGRMFEIKVGPTFEDATVAFADRLAQWESTIERVADLFLRIPRTPDAEIASTAHFAAQRLRNRMQTKPTERDVLREVLVWKRRHRPPLPADRVATAVRHLGMLGWLDLEASEDLPLEDEVLSREPAELTEGAR
jgi:O-acetyl-ADP-ribose deacetylase (regulator of RNase III)